MVPARNSLSMSPRLMSRQPDSTLMIWYSEPKTEGSTLVMLEAFSMYAVLVPVPRMKPMQPS